MHALASCLTPELLFFVGAADRMAVSEAIAKNSIELEKFISLAALAEVILTL